MSISDSQPPADGPGPGPDSGREAAAPTVTSDPAMGSDPATSSDSATVKPDRRAGGPAFNDRVAGGQALDGPVRRFGPGVRTVIVAGLAVAVGLIVWTATGSSRDGNPMAGSVIGSPKIMDAEDLAAVPQEVNHTVFWAGSLPGALTEVHDDAAGNVHIRYLTGGAAAGDPGQTYLDIGTYPFSDAFNTTRNIAREVGLQPVRAAGGIGFIDPKRPYSVIIAWPTQPDLQVEVYHPEEYRALDVVRRGDIVPLP